jgi:hypothetical protein
LNVEPILEMSMNEVDLLNLIDQLVEATGEDHEPVAVPWVRTPGCPSLPRLERGVRTDDWTAPERKHLAGCLYCKNTLRIARRLAPVSTGSELYPGLAPKAGRELFRPSGSSGQPEQPQPWRLEARLRPEARARRPAALRKLAGQGETAEAVPRTQASGGCWSFITTDGQPLLPLPAELAEQFYLLPEQGGASGRNLRLWLRLTETETGELRPEVEVWPGPTRVPMVVVLTFPGGQVRELLVPVEPSGDERKVWSQPGEVLPASVLAEEGPEELEWTVEVEVRPGRSADNATGS